MKTKSRRLVSCGVEVGSEVLKGEEKVCGSSSSVGEFVSLPPSVSNQEEEDTFRDFLPGTSTTENEKEAKNSK